MGALSVIVLVSISPTHDFHAPVRRPFLCFACSVNRTPLVPRVRFRPIGCYWGLGFVGSSLRVCLSPRNSPVAASFSAPTRSRRLKVLIFGLLQSRMAFRLNVRGPKPTTLLASPNLNAFHNSYTIPAQVIDFKKKNCLAN